MRHTAQIFALVAALAVPSVALGQDQSSAGSGSQIAAVAALAPKEQRRLEFYAEKVVVEIEAIVAASRAADLPGFTRHGKAMKSTAERLLTTVESYGLSRDHAEQLLQDQLAAAAIGPLPFFLADEAGETDLTRLLALELSAEPPVQGGSDYVSAVRDAGQNLFRE